MYPMSVACAMARSAGDHGIDPQRSLETGGARCFSLTAGRLRTRADRQEG
jgi:hypothetical protein